MSYSERIPFNLKKDTALSIAKNTVYRYFRRFHEMRRWLLPRPSGNTATMFLAGSSTIWDQFLQWPIGVGNGPVWWAC